MLFSRFCTLLCALVTVDIAYTIYFFLIHHCTNSLSSLHIFVHHCTFCASLHTKTSPAFSPFLKHPFKSSTTQRCSRLQHGFCIGVSRQSARVTVHVGKGLAQGPYVAARAGVKPTIPPVESHRLNQCATTSHKVS